MQTFQAHVEGFGNPEIVAIMMKKLDSGQNLREALLINRNGINNGEFIHYLCIERERFLSQYEYSLENLEKFFQVRFCEVRRCRLNNLSSLTFENGAKWGPDVVYINTIVRKDRRSTVNYVRITQTLIK